MPPLRAATRATVGAAVSLVLSATAQHHADLGVSFLELMSEPTVQVVPPVKPTVQQAAPTSLTGSTISPASQASHAASAGTHPSIALPHSQPSPGGQAPQQTAFRGGGSQTHQHETVLPAQGNRTQATKPEVHSQQIMVRQIFLLCVTMYGSIGVMWMFYYWRQRAAQAQDTRQPVPIIGEPQEVSRVMIGLLCISWASMSVGMHVLNKSLVSYLDAPALISGVQMVIAVVIIGAMSGQKIKHVPREQLKRWMIVPALFAGMLCSSFYAYAYISLSLLTVIRNLTPLVSLPVEHVVMPPEKRPAVNVPIVGAILVMLFGAMVYGEGILPTISFIGVAYAVLNMVLAITDRVMQRRLLTQECKDIPSDVCTIINNFFGLLPTIALAAATHQFAEAQTMERKASWSDPQVLTLLFLSGFVGIGICYLGFACQRVISATSFFVLQNVSKVAVVTAGVTFFGDPIKSGTAVCGLLMSLGGSFVYGALQMSASRPTVEAPTKKQ